MIGVLALITGPVCANLDTEGSVGYAESSAELPIIVEQPDAGSFALGGEIQLSVGVAGETLSFQWFKDGEPITSAVEAELLIPDVSYSDAGEYWVEVKNPVGSVLSTVVSVSVLQPLGILRGLTAWSTEVGGSAPPFEVFVHGSRPFSYQWFKNGEPLVGETTGSLELTDITEESSGTYSVRVSNPVSEVWSSAPLFVARVPEPLGLELRVVGDSVFSSLGGILVLEVAITNPGEELSSLGFEINLPDGWSYAGFSDDLAYPELVPVLGATRKAEIGYLFNPPDISISPHLILRYAAGLSGEQDLDAKLHYSVHDSPYGPQTRIADLSLSREQAPPTHSADSNGDYHISLTELLEVIDLYNARKGTERDGCYHLEGSDPMIWAAGTNYSLSFPNHAADTDGNGRISLPELLRVIELYNWREQGQRTGAYHFDPESADRASSGPDLP